jgi:outer membrane protein OmpA-like peptidoglycan-associated protein
MNLRTALLATTLFAAPIVAPIVAQAQPIAGLYVGGGAGINGLLDMSGKPNTGFKYESDVGAVVLGSVGWGFGNGLRAEVEGNGRFQHTRVRPRVPNGSGDGDSYGVMANVLYDFDIGQNWVYPYVGVGGGYQWWEIRSNPNSVRSTGNWAAQAIAGAAFPIATVPGLSVTAEARYLSTIGDTKVHSGRFAGKVDEQQNISGLVGVRYAFGAPAPAPMAPAPVAAPAPAPARTYLVFFDWDRADLTARARQIIAEAAQASTRVATTRIEVDGHADRSGSPTYNQGLSMRRAQAVAGELVRLGVPRTAIDIKAFVDTRPLVPTAAGVREPQNRRVEIIMS